MMALSDAMRGSNKQANSLPKPLGGPSGREAEGQAGTEVAGQVQKRVDLGALSSLLHLPQPPIKRLTIQ